MNTGQELVLDLAEQLNTIKLPLMALKLDELYRSPGYPAMDKLDFLSALLAFTVTERIGYITGSRRQQYGQHARKYFLIHIPFSPCCLWIIV